MNNSTPDNKSQKPMCIIAIVILIIGGSAIAYGNHSSVALIAMGFGLITVLPASILFKDFYDSKISEMKTESTEKLNIAKKENKDLQKTLDRMSVKIEKANTDIATVDDLKSTIEDYKKVNHNLISRLNDYKEKYLNSKIQTSDVYYFAGLCWQTGYTDLFDPFLYMSNRAYKTWMDDRAAAWSDIFDSDYYGDGDANEVHAQIIRNQQVKTRPKNSTGSDGGKILERGNRRNNNTLNNDYDEER